MKRKQTHRYREQPRGHQWEERRREEEDKGSGLKGTNYWV